MLQTNFFTFYSADLTVFDQALRMSGNAAKMANIHSILEPHCVDVNVNGLLNEIGRELNYVSLVEVANRSSNNVK